MGNLNNYQRVWGNYRNEVQTALRTRESALQRLEGYSGARADREREQIHNDFAESVRKSRTKARKEFGGVLESMREKAEGVGQVMEAPSSEAVSILQMLSLRTSISQAEAESAARALRGNDEALATLQQLCATRGGVKVKAIQKNKTKRTQAFDAVGAFKDAADAILQWEGGSRSELLSNRNRQAFEYVPASERVPLGACIAADITADCSPRDFATSAVGNACDYDAVQLID